MAAGVSGDEIFISDIGRKISMTTRDMDTFSHFNEIIFLKHPKGNVASVLGSLQDRVFMNVISYL